jgi:hypothetical protein
MILVILRVIFIQISLCKKFDAYFGKGFVFTADYSYNYYRDENVTLMNIDF